MKSIGLAQKFIWVSLKLLKKKKKQMKFLPNQVLDGFSFPHQHFSGWWVSGEPDVTWPSLKIDSTGLLVSFLEKQSFA